ncbi:hypothetical protein LTR56_014688, partial [Elasticomyces elasticus]
MQAVQVRIGMTAGMLSSRKSNKMRGFDAYLRPLIQQSRKREIDLANRFRFLLVSSVILGWTQQYLSPVITFLVFVVRAKETAVTFDESKVFTSLATLLIVAQPANEIVEVLPSLLAAVASFQCIEDFMNGKERNDFRGFSQAPSGGGWQRPSSLQVRHSGSLELDDRSLCHASSTSQDKQVIAQVQNGRFGWNPEQSVIHLTNVSIVRNQLTCIIGPTASGKSTLCKTLLGETYALQGSVDFLTPDKDMAFCDQIPWLKNTTIQENIVGYSSFDSVWYDIVIKSCALSKDLATLPRGDQTWVGSSGNCLSGGQKHRVTIARALYERKAIMILDDVLSGQDAESAGLEFQNVMGPEGAARRHGTTVIFATSGIEYLPFADHIIVMGPDGTVVQQGSFDELRSQPGHMQELSVAAIRAPIDEGEKVGPKEGERSKETNNKSDQHDRKVRTGDWATYIFYCRAAGFWTMNLFVLLGITYAGLASASTAWLEIWAYSPSGRLWPSDLGFLGVYALLRILALIFLGCFVYLNVVSMATKTGLRLHRLNLETVLNAPYSYTSTIGVGELTNRFSQDMTLLDAELPLGLLSLASCIFIAIGQTILIIISVPWAGLAFPIILGVLYSVQRFYLRTSRQLRLLDLEAKSRLYTIYQETMSGLCTIRSFGWTNRNLSANGTILDDSQRPVYLLAMVQRWLALVIDVVVAVLSVTLVAFAVTLRASAGSIGVAMTQVLSMSLLLSGIIFSWTGVETTLAALTRTRNFIRDTPVEHAPGTALEPPSDWPATGKIQFESLTAGYS